MSGDTSVLTNLLSLYMEYILEIGSDQPTLEGYCRYAEIDTTLFYDHFDTIQDIEKRIWSYMLSTATDTVYDDPQYAQFGQDEKLLSLLYTFFENLSLNRNYFVKHLEMRKGLRQKRTLFSLLKTEYSNYLDQTLSQDGLFSKGIEQIEIIKEIYDRSQHEAFWLQLVFLIDFWQKDLSEEQSKTDIAIEKSVRAAIDLLEAAPVKSVFDLGKFIWQERLAKSNDPS